MMVGTKVGPFDIEKALGSGAMGTVYLARYRKTGQLVALKVMAPGMADNETALARFEREGDVLKQLRHPNIVRFYVAAQSKGTPYYAMEYVEGEPLDRLLQRRGRLSWEEVVDLGKQTCAALQHAHDQGIVHRDLKPSNLIVTSDGVLKLTDFGIAKDLDVTQLTAANCTVGTASYMSPEQCRGERNLTHKSDLYSLGVVFYELLTGDKPFKAETTMAMFLEHVGGKFERPSRLVLDIPIWLDNLVCQLLEKKPEHRPFDAPVVMQALDQVAEKVAAQRSAGVDAVAGKIGDHTTKKLRADKTDRETARALASSLRGERGKRYGKPIYEQGWVQALGILVLLGGLAGIFYKVFLEKPPPEQLYREAEKVMQKKDIDAWLTARDEKGPIGKFLKYYGNQGTEEAAQVQRWADTIDWSQKERALYKRRNVMQSDGPSEQRARDALDHEERGNLVQARETWEGLLKHKDDRESPDRPWGLLAEKRLEDLKAADKIEEGARRALDEAHAAGQLFKPGTPAERLVSEALRYEDLKDLSLARRRWLELRRTFDKDMEQHGWALLAAKRAEHLKSKVPQDDEEVQKRVAALSEALEEAKMLKPSKAKIVYLEIIDLYEKDQEKEVAQVVEQARALLKPPADL
jgi:serine/threonine-protein kinase